MLVLLKSYLPILWCALDQITLHRRPRLILPVSIDAALMKLALSFSTRKDIDRSAAGLKLQAFTCAMSDYLRCRGKS